MKPKKFKQTGIGMIPEEWEVLRIEELLLPEKGAIKIGPFGSQLKKEFLVKGGIKVYGQENIYKSDFELGDRYITKERFEILKSCELKSGDIIISMMGTIGFVDVVPLNIKKGIMDSHLLRMRANQNKIDNNFLLYAFRSGVIQNQIDTLSVGTIMAGLSSSIIKLLIFPLPPMLEQQFIAKILSDLDSKIELNQQMNKTLEAIGQAIFKRWFIDFEFPNEKGKPYKSSGGEMVESELGKIPKGWNVKRIKDCGLVVCGKTPPTKEKENYGEDIFFITIPDMHNKFFVINTERKLSKKGADTQKKKELPPLTVCVSCIATPGLVVLTSEKSQTNQQINSIICNNEISPYFMYLTMKEKAEEIKSRGLGGTATLNLNTGDFENLKIILPEKEVIADFHKLINVVFKKLLTTEYQIQNLSQIRDSLLPRLMSGKIRVPVEAKT